MRGLLIKDWYQARKYCRSLLLIAVVFAAVSVFSDNTLFAIYPLMLGALLPVTLHAYDERSGFLRCACTMPVSRRNVVASRYAELLLALGLGLAVLGAVRTIGALFGAGDTGSTAELLVMALLLVDLAALLLPLIFRFGTERARMLVALMLLFGSDLSARLLDMYAVVRYGVIALGLAVLPLSYLLSLRIYRKKAL